MFVGVILRNEVLVPAEARNPHQNEGTGSQNQRAPYESSKGTICHLYTSDAADDPD